MLVAVLYLIVLLQAFVLEFRRSQQAQIALRALEKEREKQQSGGIVVRVDRRNVPIDFDQILYIESLSDYVRLILDETDSLITKERISHLQQALPASFLRIHRSFIVNLTRVTAYTREYVEIGEDQIPISRTYKKEALAALATYLA